MIGNYSVVGQGYGFFTDTILPSKIFNIHHVPTAYGMAIPSIAQIHRKNTTETTLSSADTMEKLIESRLGHLHLNADVTDNLCYGLFKYASKAGIELSKSSSSTQTYHSSLIHEEKMFEVFLPNVPLCKNSYTHDFIAAVDECSDGSNGCNPGQPTWWQFFSRWGLFVITKASGGGSIEIQVDSGSLEKSGDKGDIEAHLKAAHKMIFSKESVNVDVEGKSVEFGQVMSDLTLNVVGGSVESRDFGTIITREELNNWRDTLKTHPEMLTTKMSLEPITTFIQVVAPEKYDFAVKCFQKYLIGIIIEKIVTKEE